MKSIPAISLWQPWAHLVACGAKRYETRAWKIPYRGPMAIHAGKKWTARLARRCLEEPFASVLLSHGAVPPLEMAFGCVVAVGRLVDIRPAPELVREIGAQELAFGDFSHGRWAWEYDDMVPLEVPFPCTGRQGIFHVVLPAR
jgi:activating signal cointegrator 1